MSDRQDTTNGVVNAAGAVAKGAGKPGASARDMDTQQIVAAAARVRRERSRPTALIVGLVVAAIGAGLAGFYLF